MQRERERCDERREKVNKISQNIFGIDVRTISYLRQYSSSVAKFLRFSIPNEDWFLVFGVPNAKYLASGIPSTKNQSSLGIPKLKNFATPLQYCLNYEMVRTSMPKIFWLILFTFLSPLITYLSLCLQHISLSTLSVAFLLS